MADTVLHTLPIKAIAPGTNARGDDVGDVTDLAASLRAVGQLLPVVVEPVDGGLYRLLDGHRRHAAAKLARLTHLTAVVRSAPIADAARTIAQLTIQTHAKPIDPIAEAVALHALMFPRAGSDQQPMTREQIAHLVGRPPGWVRDRIALVHLEPVERRAVAAGSMSVAEGLRRLNDRRAMREGREPVARNPVPATPAKPRAAGGDAARLAPAEVAVLRHLAQGLERREIAAAMNISDGTAKSYLERAYKALGASNGANAVHLAYQAGILRVGDQEVTRG